EVHHRHVGPAATHAADGFLAVGGLGHHRHVGLGVEQHAQAGAQDGVIVGQHHSDLLHARPSVTGISTLTRVPRPGADWMVRVPLSTSARSRMVWMPRPWAAVAGAGGRSESNPMPSSLTTMETMAPKRSSCTRT